MLFGEGPQIKNIAADLNKLFRQGSLLNQSGQTVEGDSTADQGTSDLLAARDPVIQEISVGMSGEQAARYTVSGTPPLSLPNSLGKPLKAWEVDVVPYQEGTGDPSPSNVRAIHGTNKVTMWTGGQNLFQTTAESKTENGVTWTVNADGSVSVSGVATDYTTLNLGDSYINPLWGAVTISGITSSTNIAWASVRLMDDTDATVYSISTGGFTPSYTVDLSQYPTATKIRIAVKRNNNSTVSGTVMPMINLGATALPFVQYLSISQTVLTLPQTVYTGTIGSDGGESRWGEVDLGSNVFSWTYDNSGKRWQSTLSGLKSFATRSAEILAEKYKADITAVAGSENVMFTIGGAIYIYYSDSINQPSGKLVYPLANPVQFSVPSATIPTPTGTATTWATAEDGTVDGMEVTYVGKA